MKSLCLLLFSAAVMAAQPFGFGLKAGVPTNDFLDTVSNQSFRFNTTTNRYIVGPMVELRLPAGFGIEFNALYRHFGYNFSGTPAGSTGPVNGSVTTGAWEFPLMAKYKFKGVELLRPYVEAGISWDKLSGVSQTITRTISNVTSTSSENPFELRNDATRGFVMGAGLDIKALFIHVSPEIRYTRWGARHFVDPGGLLSSNQNQGEFLIGFTF
jgi:opacity protein-like surface antigen